MAGAPTGNKNGAKGKQWLDSIRRAISRKANGDLNHGLDQLADKLVAAALAGDQWALMEIGNRFDGKPAQVIAGDPDAPLAFTEIGIRPVEPTSGGSTGQGG